MPDPRRLAESDGTVCSCPMRRRSTGPAPDVFETFAHRIEPDEETPRARPVAATVARSAGITVGLMVLTSLAFVGGAWVAGGRRPDLAYSNLLWEGVVVALWSLAWGALAAMAVLAAGVLAVGVPWVRRQRGSREASGSRDASGSREASGSRATSTSAP